jgi:hypothetical protein
MMNNQPGHFEHLEHRNSSGETRDVPLYVGEHEDLTPESQVLLDAVNLLTPNLGKFDRGLEDLIDQVGDMISDPQSKGLIIEDDEGGGSVRIDGETTHVRVRGKGMYDIPTPLFFDMLYTWAGYESDGQD